MVSDRPTVVIPALAGIETPLPELAPGECDVLIVGTGIVESILAASLAWQGSNVLHIDAHDHYGDTSSTLTVDQLKKWTHNVNNSLPGYNGFKNALLYIPREKDLKSKEYGIDLNPRILFAKSDLLTLLIKSRVYKYLELLPLSTYHTYENDSFEKIASTKEDIFTDQSLSLTTKRYLMKFIKFVFTYETEIDQWIEYKNKPFIQFIEEKFNLLKPQCNEIVFSIGLASTPNILTPEGLSRVKRYISSFDVYGDFPLMYSKYGGPGEISQGFCRSAAVAGATYKLATRLSSFDPLTKIAKFSDGSKVKVNEKIVCSPSQAPQDSKLVPGQKYEITRLTAVVKKSCKEWMSNRESSCLVIFPSMSLPTSNEYPVQVIIMGEGAGVCPSGQSIWYLSTVERGERARSDLEAALLKLEESLLRESEEDGLNTLLEDSELLVSLGNGLSLINSVKLGKSFKDFVPKQKIQYLLKLQFTQYTSIPHFGVVNSKLFKHEEKTDQSAPDNGILYSNMPSSEISYDGIITESKLLYTKIVGDDEDFFEIDFEDEEEFEHDQQMAIAAVLLESKERRNSSLSPLGFALSPQSRPIGSVRGYLIDEESAIDDGDDIEMDFDL